MNKTNKTNLAALTLAGLLTHPLADAAPELALGSAAGLPGEVVTIPIRVTNDGTVAGFQYEIHYDATQLTSGQAAPAQAFANGYRVASSETASGVRRIVIAPPVSNPVISTGLVVNVPFTIKAGANSNSKLLTLTQVIMSDGNANAVLPTKLANGLIANTNNNLADTDNDGMPDVYEVANSLQPTDAGDAVLDADGDGLTNLQEYSIGTAPTVWDSDSDGIPDGYEVAYGLNPLFMADGTGDPDGDGLSNLNEYLSGANPFSADTDQDGLDDSEEVALGTNPAKADTDGDGVSDADEVALGTDPLLNIPALMVIIQQLLLN